MINFVLILVGVGTNVALADLLGDPNVKSIFVFCAVVYVLGRMVNAYLTAFHRKSGNRLMYDGEPEEWRWRWPKE